MRQSVDEDIKTSFVSTFSRTGDLKKNKKIRGKER